MEESSRALVDPPVGPQELMAKSTMAAEASREIVKRTAVPIQGRKYVQVEGWQAIATAHGCCVGSYGVERVEGGVRALARITRIENGAVILDGVEGFVGDDEPTWAGRKEFAKRAMAQTRAISRAARSAFAHVVVMIDNELGTTPAEEMRGTVEDPVDELQDWLEENEEKVNPYLVQINWIKEGQTFRDMSEINLGKIRKRPSNFKKKATGV